MSEDRYSPNGYEVIQSVEIGGMEIVIAENLKAEKPYMMWRRPLDQPFGSEEYMLPVFDSDYLKILRAFIECQSTCADGLGLDRVYRGSYLEDHPLHAGDCVPGGMDAGLKGKVVAIKAEALSPEYRACSHQLLLADGGFGCSPESRGRAVFGVNLYSGEQERWRRSDILGVVRESALPAWAREKRAALSEPAERGSLLAKLREAQSVAKETAKTEKKPAEHDHSEPEL